MKVHASNTAGFAVQAPTSRRGSTGGAFSIDSGDAPRAAAATTAPRALGSIDALIALQAFEDPAERRRRAVKRGRTTLDALDALKVGLLAGDLDSAALARIEAEAASVGETSGDPGLDHVLAEIGLRAAVEVAKFAVAQAQTAESPITAAA
jgi:hypothetical protein